MFRVVNESAGTADGWPGGRNFCSDYTTAELESRLDRYFGEDKEAMLGRRYQVVK